MKRRILHLLHWDFQMIIDNLPRIQECGYNAIQTAPIQPHKKFWKEDFDTKHREWWKNYQPTDICIEDEEGFANLCRECHKYDIEVYPDIVVRHLANKDDDNLKPSSLCNKDLLDNPYFWLEPKQLPNSHNRWEQTYRCTGLPALDYNNWELQDKYILPFLLKVLKYADGIRLDQMMHFSLPSENGSFFTRVIDNLPKDKFLYGEGINCASDKLDEYSKYMKCIVANYEYYGRNEETVRFFESHDTNLSFMYTLYMTDNVRLMEWNKITSQYDNCLFYARKDDNIMFSEEMKRINNTYAI